MSGPSFDHEPIWDLAKARFSLGNTTIHGEGHWQKVHENGQEVGKTCGADLEVVSLFAILHDCCRQDDGDDPEHGLRAARFTAEISPQYLTYLSREQLAVLLFAIANHTAAGTTNDPTLGTCLDADRLEYGRDGSKLEAKYMSTDAAKRKVHAINSGGESPLNISLFAESNLSSQLPGLLTK